MYFLLTRLSFAAALLFASGYVCEAIVTVTVTATSTITHAATVQVTATATFTFTTQ